MASSSEQSFTKTLVGDINIPDDLLYDGKTSKERQTENQKLVSAMVKKLLKDKLQNNDGILELENDFLYILSLNAIIPKPSQQHLLWARHSNLPCNPDSIERGFKKYADFLPNMSCCPLQMQDICDVQKALKNLLPEKITAFACLDKKGDWGYEFLTFGNELHFAYFEQYDFKVVFIPKFPLSEKNKSDLSSLLGALLQNDLAPLDKSLSEHFNQLKNAQIVSPGAKPDLAVLKEKLINCDLTRFGLDSYDAKILTDVDRGHWDLWNLDAKQEDTTTVSIPTGQWLVARDPVADILNGVVAIDFGTKSTVVVRMEESGIPQPMRIGLGNLRKAATVKDYENPTVLEFRDYAGFRKAYKAKAGRPCTRMDQITISHSAANALLESAAEDYHAYLAELKQWAGDKTRTLCIMDKKNKERIELPVYSELTDENLDPIEIYAYQLGLNINNMIQKISLDYILSFPVTYDKSIQERIMESFRRGLRKSLPEQLLNNEEAMKRFRISAGASEPAAYAICALKQFGFDPDDDERFAFAVFDFGGGTTDFDFGIWRKADSENERRYDYVIEHHGAGGDSRLGGENILERLAYETFIKNENEIRKKDIVLKCPTGCTPPPGFEYLLNDSQEAGLNMRFLMKAMRPLWERHEGYEKDFDSGKIKVDLFNAKGELQSGLELEVSREDLEASINNLINAGIKQFFYKMEQVFGNSELLKGCSGGIQIFLAGNSCKSPVVTDIFEKHIREEEDKIRQNAARGTNGDSAPAASQSLYHLFPPLGTNEAEKIRRERNCEENSCPTGSPSGKTGVAFGLIDCRRGSRVKIIDHSITSGDIAFKYFVGYKYRNRELKRDCLKPLLSPLNKYNEWKKLFEAEDEVFEFYYTTLPEAASGRLAVPSEGIKYQRKGIAPRDNAMIFLRTISPSVIEYMIADENDDGQPGTNIYVQPTAIELDN